MTDRPALPFGVYSPETPFDDMGIIEADRGLGANRDWLRVIMAVLATAFLAVSIACAVIVAKAKAHDDGRYANMDPRMHAWFEQLASGKGLCCSVSDGRVVEDPDIDISSGHYRVRVDKQWLDVPEDALVTVPNIYKRPLVWPMMGPDGKLYVRCFLPGSGA